MPQVWPTSDPFDHGSPAYGQAVIGYLGVLPTLGSYASGRLFSGYGAGLASLQLGAVAGDTAGVMRRQAFTGDCRVTAVTRIHAVSGAASSSDFQQAGVVARIQGGTLEAAGGTSEVLYRDVDGYGFTVTQLTSTTLRFRLVRWNAGVETVLITLDGSSADLGHFLTDVTLILEVKANGADVDLKASVSQIGFAEPVGSLVYQPGGPGGAQLTGTLNPGGPLPSVGTILPPPSLSPDKPIGSSKAGGIVDVLSFTDSAAGKITGPGRCGFLADVERVGGGGTPDTVSLTSVFEVAELSGSLWTVAWRDEWSRTSPSLGEALTDLHGTVGRNLGSDYSRDQASIETTHVLTRSTAEEAAEMSSQLDLGQAVELEGDKLQYISISSPENVFPAPASPVGTEISIYQWLRIDANRDGNEFYDGYRPSVSLDEQGFRWGWRDAGSGDAVIEVTLGGKATPQVFQTPTFSASTYTGSTWCWVLTYKANADTGSGDGRIRIYVGRFGVTTLLGEMTVPADTRPTWLLGYRHLIGSNVDGGVSADRDFDGVVDSFGVFYAELTAAQAATTCDQFGDHQALVAFNLVHAVDFETVNDNSPLAREYQPWLPAGLPVFDWWLETGPSGLPLLADPGLVPVFQAPLVVWSQRPADDPVNQSQSIDVKPASDFSLAGVVVRGTPTSDPGVYTAYRMDVAPGTPAPLSLYRVVNGVATLLAQQDMTGSPVAVSKGVYAALELTVQQQADSLPTGAVQLSARVGGTAVTWTAISGAGAGTDTSGNVVDLHDDRILSGPGVGFHTLVENLATLLDDWQAVAFVTLTDYPNLAFPAESDGAFGDLGDVLTVEYTVEPVQIAPRRSVEFESGHQQRTALATYEPRLFRVSATLSPAERAALDAFWDAHDGPVIGFNWDPSTIFSFHQAGVFHFREKSLSVQRAYQVNYRVTFELEERRASAASP